MYNPYTVKQVRSKPITPGRPERALTARVKAFTGKVSCVNSDKSRTANSPPTPEKAVRKTDLKKCLLLSEAVSIIIKETANTAINIPSEKAKAIPPFLLFI